MSEPIIEKAKQRMQKAIEALKQDFALVRTGRANPAVLMNLKVSYWGSPTPLSNIASIKQQDAQTIIIQPYDRSILKDVQKAIQVADLNLNPIVDATVIRISFPPLTQEIREGLVKDIKKKAETSKVGVRNIRKDTIDDLKKIKKQISEDLYANYEEEVQKETDKTIEEIDKLASAKEKDLMQL